MSDDDRRTYGLQVLGSLLVAALIIALTIAMVTAKLGAGEDSRGRVDPRSEDRSGPG